MVMNEVVKVYCKAVTTQVFTVVSLLVELGTSIAKSKDYIDAYPSIRQPSVTVPSNSPVVYPPLFASLRFISDWFQTDMSTSL